MEISLPNEAGRREILKIHTTLMKNYGKLHDDVSLEVHYFYLELSTVIISLSES